VEKIMTRSVRAFAALFLFTCGLQAGVIEDPEISIDPSFDSTGVHGVFTFSSNSTGGGILHFFNEDPFTWVKVEILAPYPGGPFVCRSVFFLTCGATFANGIADIVFQGIDPNGGIPSGIHPGGHFVINLDHNFDDTGVGGWLIAGQPVTFEATTSATITPEPGTVGLMLGGLAGMLLLYRRRSNSASS
jgi:hypothetical protein